MKVLVCGGRDFSDVNYLHLYMNALQFVNPISLLIHGAARGADSIAAGWALSRGVPAKAYPADWHKYGNAAGPIRNQQMLDEGRPDMVVAFPGGAGTENMVKLARKAGVVTLECSEIPPFPHFS